MHAHCLLLWFYFRGAFMSSILYILNAADQGKILSTREKWEKQIKNKPRWHEEQRQEKWSETQTQNPENTKTKRTKRRTGESTWTTQANQGEAKNQNPNFDFVWLIFSVVCLKHHFIFLFFSWLASPFNISLGTTSQLVGHRCLVAPIATWL